MTDRQIDARWLQDRIRLMLRPMSRMASAPPRDVVPSAWWDGYHRALKDLELAVERRLRHQHARETQGNPFEHQQDGGGA